MHCRILKENVTQNFKQTTWEADFFPSRPAAVYNFRRPVNPEYHKRREAKRTKMKRRSKWFPKRWMRTLFALLNFLSAHPASFPVLKLANRAAEKRRRWDWIDEHDEAVFRLVVRPGRRTVDAFRSTYPSLPFYEWRLSPRRPYYNAGKAFCPCRVLDYARRPSTAYTIPAKVASRNSYCSRVSRVFTKEGDRDESSRNFVSPFKNTKV